jgi:hypothetical protein
VTGGGAVKGVYRQLAGQLAVDAWEPLVQRFPASPPHYDEILKHAKDHIAGGRLQKWSGIIPIKLIAIIQGWSASECSEFYVPLGAPVRMGLRRVVGVRIRNNEPRSDQNAAWYIHERFAKLAKTDIFTINSGFWKAGL